MKIRDEQRADLAKGLVIFLLVMVIYLPVWSAGYIWDDGSLLVNNPCMNDVHGLSKIWTTSAAMMAPLTLTTFWVLHAFFGIDPFPFHLTTVILHGLDAILLWRVLRCIKAPGAWWGAILWAVHPVLVESVAWVSELKNTQSAFFFFLNLLFFMRWFRVGRNLYYGFALLFGACAMASKSSTVILPGVLCLWMWWEEGTWRWRYLFWVSPYILSALAAGALAEGIEISSLQQGFDDHSILPWPEKIIVAGQAVWFYFDKLVWPYPLYTGYPRWSVVTAEGWSYLPMASLMLLGLLLWLKRNSVLRPYFFIYAYFILALLPVICLVNNPYFRIPYLNDHFQYLASMGPISGLGMLLARWGRTKPRMKFAVGTTLLALWSALSWQQAHVYQNPQTLWSYTLRFNPKSWVAHSSLGREEVIQGQYEAARIEYERALELSPQDPDSYNNLGLVLSAQEHWNEAVAAFQKALAINPAQAGIEANLGNAKYALGQPEAGREEWQKALAQNPKETQAYYYMGYFSLGQGNWDQAKNDFQKILELKPNDASAENALGEVCLKKGQADEAICFFEKALSIEPRMACAQQNLAQARAIQQALAY